MADISLLSEAFDVEDVLGEVCLAVELLPLSPFCKDYPVPTGYPVTVFHVAAAQDRHFGALSPSSESFFLIPALGYLV